MRLLLLASLLPIFLYLTVFFIAYIKAKSKGEQLPMINSRNLLNSFLASLVLAIISFFVIFYFSTLEAERGDYISPARQMMKKR